MEIGSSTRHTTVPDLMMEFVWQASAAGRTDRRRDAHYHLTCNPLYTGVEGYSVGRLPVFPSLNSIMTKEQAHAILELSAFRL